jgi:hypothetical protein
MIFKKIFFIVVILYNTNLFSRNYSYLAQKNFNGKLSDGYYETTHHGKRNRKYLLKFHNSFKNIEVSPNRIFRITPFVTEKANVGDMVLKAINPKKISWERVWKTYRIVKILPNQIFQLKRYPSPPGLKTNIVQAKYDQLVSYVSENLRLAGEDCNRVNLIRYKWTKLRQSPV